LMSALYDSGQFRVVALTSPDGEVLFERRGEGVPGRSAPAWFERLTGLVPARATRNVSAGWDQVGELVVEVDSGPATQALWNSTLQCLLLLLVAGLLWGLFAAVLVRWVRRALLNEVATQLRSLEADTEAVPAKRDVLDVSQHLAHAINDVRERVRATSQELSARLKSSRWRSTAIRLRGRPTANTF